MTRQESYIVVLTDGTVPETNVNYGKPFIFDLIKDKDNGCDIEFIWQVNPVDQTFRDVSEDIAKEYFEKFSENYNDVDNVPDFITKQCDDTYIEDVLREQRLQNLAEERHNAGYSSGQAGRA
jgi:hypothetical protein